MELQQQNMPIKKCRICGDDANCFNFNVVCCESCKSFFRRNALLKHEKWKCRGDGENCLITKLNRTDCKSCRLKKCLEIGMDKEKIYCRRNRAQTEIQSQIIEIHKNSTDLKGHELERLIEIRSAVTDFHDEESNLPVTGEAQSVMQLASFEPYLVDRVIKCCKNLATFKILDQSDQLVLLAKFYEERSLVQGSFLYDLDKEGCYMMKVENSTNVKSRVLVKSSMIQACTKPKSFYIYRNFMHSLHREMENDSTIYELLLAQLLYKHHEATIEHEYIRYNHILYRYLLKRYLEAKYASADKAKEKYRTLMSIMKQIEDVLSVFRNIFYHILAQQNEQSEQFVSIEGEIVKLLKANCKIENDEIIDHSNY